MKNYRIIPVLFLAALGVFGILRDAAAKPTIKEIRVESPTATADRIIFELNGPYLPTGKALPGDNPRVYFDFADTVPAGNVKNRMSADGNFVKQIRHAYHKAPQEKTRVVFDLTANRKMEFRQDFNQDTNTLVITLYLAGTEPEPPALEPPPATVAEPEPEPELSMPSPESKPEAEPEVARETMQEEMPGEEDGKQMPQMEDAGMAPVPTPELQVPEHAQEMLPEQPEPEMQETLAEQARPVPEMQDTPAAQIEPEQKAIEEAEPPRLASVPPAPSRLDIPADEATTIQPMSEVGIQEPSGPEDVVPVLHSIEFDPKSNRGEMISFKLNGFHPPVVFGIEEDIPRIVCFFKNAKADSGVQDISGTGGQYVKSIKVGKYENPDNVRVVLELVPGNNYDLQQIFFKDDKVFMMVINKAGKQITPQGN